MGKHVLPKHDQLGVIPPFVGEPTSGVCSPYRAEIADVVARFGVSKHRRDVLRGLLRYREELRKEGFEGFQWLDGGFLDRKAEEPKDVDLITFYRRKQGWSATTMVELADRRPELVDETFSTFMCDAYFIDLDDDDREFLARYIAYWVGVFSHQRVTGVRRGLVQVALGPDEDDGPAYGMLDTLDSLEETESQQEPKK